MLNSRQHACILATCMPAHLSRSSRSYKSLPWQSVQPQVRAMATNCSWKSVEPSSHCSVIERVVVSLFTIEQHLQSDTKAFRFSRSVGLQGGKNTLTASAGKQKYVCYLAWYKLSRIQTKLSFQVKLQFTCYIVSSGWPLSSTVLYKRELARSQCSCLF